MKHEVYTSDDFNDLNTQHNIIGFIGNGFDIRMLQAEEKESTTSYSDFFKTHLEPNEEQFQENALYLEMKEKYLSNDENWADFEAGIVSLLNNTSIAEQKLTDDLTALQYEFSKYLNEVNDPEFSFLVGEVAQANHHAINTLSNLVADIDAGDFNQMKFPTRTAHYDLYNFTFVNFNYTTIFDNYIYLDKNQFESHPFSKADRNFSFRPNPMNYPVSSMNWNSDTAWSSYLVLNDVIHPHGLQSIPKSMLFGINDTDRIFRARRNQKEFSGFIKPYWAQNDLKYSKLFDDTQLFILFGVSIGESDKWWWQKIAVELINNPDAEMIIYYYAHDFTDENKKEKKVEAINKFIDNSGISDEDGLDISDRIYVIVYNNQKKYMNTFKVDDKRK